MAQVVGGGLIPPQYGVRRNVSGVVGEGLRVGGRMQLISQVVGSPRVLVLGVVMIILHRSRFKIRFEIKFGRGASSA